MGLDRPLSLFAQLHSLVFVLLFRVPTLAPRPRLASRSRTLPAWVSSLFATSPNASTVGESSHLSHPVPPPGSLNLSAACSALGSRACSIPLPRIGFTVQGFLPHLSHPDSSPGDPSLPLDAPRSLPKSVHGEAPSTSRSCSENRCVRRVWLYPPPRSLPSSVFFLLQVFSFCAAPDGLPSRLRS